MPPDFKFPARAQLWVLGDRGGAVPSSLDLGKNPGAQRDVHISSVIGRLRPKVTRAQAQAEMSTIAQHLAAAYPKTNAGLGANVITLHEQVVGGSRLTLFVLLGAVALVLLIACANVANLLLAWATKREREIAIRLALGAGRGRLLRQMLTESLVLSLTGGLFGLAVAVWAVDLFVGISPPDIPRLDQVSVDGALLAFTIAISLLTGVAFGTVPAWRASRFHPQHGLQNGGSRASDAPGRRGTQNQLVIAEIAVAQVLLLGAGLLIMSFVRLQATDPGFNPANLLSGRVSLSDSTYSEPRSKVAFYDQVMDRVEAIGGVRSAALVMTLPLDGGAMNRGFRIEGRPEPTADENVAVDYQLISPGYFSTMEIPLLAGRTFAATDAESAPRVAIVSQMMARKYFRGQVPIGKRIAFGDPSKQDSWRTIVGVVAEVRYENIGVPPFPLAYAPYRQNSEPWSQMAIVLRTQLNPTALTSDLRKAILSVDPNQPVTNVQTMEELMAAGVTQPRFTMLLIGTLAGIALALAAAGIYGVMAYAVARRTHEIGIRMALGAATSDVLALIVRQGMRLTLAGVALGVLGGFALLRVLAKMLYGISSYDPATFVAISLLLILVALLACYLPARRAARLDPMLALGRG
jgi:putative ABC transport system permease protein